MAQHLIIFPRNRQRLDTLLRIESVPNQADFAVQGRKFFSPSNHCRIGISNHGVCPSRYRTLHPSIHLSLEFSAFSYVVFGKWIAKIGNPRKTFSAGQLQGSKMRSERRKCRENRNANIPVCVDVCSGGAESEIGPSGSQLPRQKHFPDCTFNLPSEATSGMRDKWIWYVLRVRVVAASLVSSGKDAAGVSQSREVLREAKGPRSSNRVLWRIVVREDQDYVFGHWVCSSTAHLPKRNCRKAA